MIPFVDLKDFNAEYRGDIIYLYHKNRFYCENGIVKQKESLV